MSGLTADAWDGEVMAVAWDMKMVDLNTMERAMMRVLVGKTIVADQGNGCNIL